MDKQRPNYIILNPWRSEIVHPWLPENMEKQRPNYIILNPWRSEIVHPLLPENMDKQRPNYIILNPWRSEIVHPWLPENMEKQRPNYIILNPWRSEIVHPLLPENMDKQRPNYIILNPCPPKVHTNSKTSGVQNYITITNAYLSLSESLNSKGNPEQKSLWSSILFVTQVVIWKAHVLSWGWLSLFWNCAEKYLARRRGIFLYTCGWRVPPRIEHQAPGFLLCVSTKSSKAFVRCCPDSTASNNFICINFLQTINCIYVTSTANFKA